MPRPGPIAWRCRIWPEEEARRLVRPPGRRRDQEELGAQLKPGQAKRFEKNVAKAQAKDSMKAFNKLVQMVDGHPRLVGDPPLIVPLEELLPDLAYRPASRRRCTTCCTPIAAA